MLVECATITIIIGAIFFVFLRGRKVKSAFFTLPLVVVPLVHILGYPLSKWISEFTSINVLTIYTVVDILAFFAFLVIAGLLLKNFRSRKTRVAYTISSGAFTLTLTIILLLDLFKRLS